MDSGKPSPGAEPEPSVDAINVSKIRVAGIGGLGLVAMAAVVAWAIPRSGFTLLLGIGLGAALSAFLIVRRDRKGGLPSSGQRAGANVVLSIDDPIAPRPDAAADDDRRSTRDYAAVRGGGSVALSTR